MLIEPAIALTHLATHSVWPNIVKNIENEEIRTIFRHRFWNPLVELHHLTHQAFCWAKATDKFSEIAVFHE